MQDKDYKVIGLSQEPPKPYTNSYGTTYYKDVRLADANGVEHPKPVSLGKKSPEAFTVGMELYGHILVEQSFPTDKFKSVSKQQGSFGGFAGTPAPAPSAPYSGSSKPAYQPKDEAAIKAMWSIGQAVQLLHGTTKIPNEASIQMWANTFFQMVEDVKNGVTAKPAQAADPIQTYRNIATTEELEDGSPIPDYPGDV